MAEHAVPDNSMRAVSHIPKFDGTDHREWNYEIDLCFQNLDIADVMLGLELCPDETIVIPEHIVAHRSHIHLSSRAFVRVPDTAKLDARSQEGIFVGRCNTQNVSRVFIPDTRKIVVSKDVKVDEEVLYRDMKNLPSSTHELRITDTEDEEMNVDEAEPLTHPNGPQSDEASTPFTDANLIEDVPIHDNPIVNEEETLPENLIHEDKTPSTTKTYQRDEDSRPHQRVRQSTRTPKYSERFLEWQQSLAKQATLSSVSAETQEYRSHSVDPHPTMRIHEVESKITAENITP
ncbi:hypothetical protein DAPPUDRAFT_117556 [Daphnia pulex]|uniref:Retroviral polymerase SH3-like domain-containing protein n=1 Tax=Daphnia pulex TaxID=6669 RepID=E9HT29_DAPPU|nr:hypothetical protein DAPPUDRAFT_117556 [Daphnia pulex]|eukprot:EFX65098.1 hypothetical protein DAPPUDRAFT_117556 [Daphnia pulex]